MNHSTTSVESGEARDDSGEARDESREGGDDSSEGWGLCLEEDDQPCCGLDAFLILVIEEFD